MIAIIDYGVGNLASLTYALKDLNYDYKVLSKPEELSKCELLILPGVGHAEYAMEKLEEGNLITFLKSCKKPLIGICLGMQLLYEYSEESKRPLLGLIPGKLKQFSNQSLPKVHMGWNDVKDGDVYFVHSYYAPINEFTWAKSVYGSEFTSIVRKENYIGFQFHPEKSGVYGLELLNEAIKDLI